MKFSKTGKLTAKQLEEVERDSTLADLYKEQFAVPKIGEGLARRVLQLLDYGLCEGEGDGTPGNMCVEVAVSYAMGEEDLTDHPIKCVKKEVSDAKIALNDMSGWPTNIARGKGLRRVAIAQLGSKKINANKFRDAVAFHLIREVLAPSIKNGVYSLVHYEDGGKALKTLMTDLKTAKTNKEMIKAFAAFKASEHYNDYEHDDHDKFIKDALINKDSTTSMIHAIEDFLPRLSKHDERHAGLKKIAKAIELALIDCKAQGTEWLYLTEGRKKAAA